MPRKRPTGVCHICGEEGPLSYEHIPPKQAFNDRPVVAAAFGDLFALGPEEEPRGPVQQRGAGGYTLCERCNNITGKWYGNRFIDWCWQGMRILVLSGGNPSLIYLHYLFPLAIIKQIVTMFFSVNSPRFRIAHPELVRFVLNRDAKYLPPKYRIYAYYNTSRKARRSGVSVKFQPDRGRVVMSEISHFPYGYVMTFDSPPPDQRLADITHFSRYDYQEFVVQEVKMSVLPTHMFFPGDYRTLEQIDATVQENERLIAQQQSEQEHNKI